MISISNNENSILVEPENPRQLSEAIMKLLENKVMREKLGLAGYEFVHKECNSVSMAQNSLSLYQEIIKNKPNK